MKQEYKLILAAVLVCLLSVMGLAQVRQVLVEAIKPGLSLSIDKGCGAVYAHDELLNITIRSTRSGYLTIFDFTPDKHVQVIFPNKYYTDNYIEAKKDYSIPGDLLPFQLRIAPPDGQEVLYAVITAKPYDLTPEKTYDFDDIFPQLSENDEETAYSLAQRLVVVPANIWRAVAMCHFYVGQEPSTHLGDGWALFIGVDDYDETVYTGTDGKQYRFPKLNYCVKGAQEIAAELQSMFPTQRILVDHDVTHDSVQQAITGWLSQAPEGATVLIYYSGHGSRVVDTSGDELDGYDETIVPWDYGTKKQFILDDELRRWLSLLSADNVVMIFDSCHSGTMTRNVYTASLVSTSRAVEPPLTDGLVDDFGSTAGSRGTWWKQFAISASKPNESAWESQALQNGVLTYYLIKGLEGEADTNRDGWVTTHEVYEYAAKMVTLQFPDQHPQMTDDIKKPIKLTKTD
jgi:hypothetical protein